MSDDQAAHVSTAPYRTRPIRISTPPHTLTGRRRSQVRSEQDGKMRASCLGYANSMQLRVCPVYPFAGWCDWRAGYRPGRMVGVVVVRLGCGWQRRMCMLLLVLVLVLVLAAGADAKEGEGRVGRADKDGESEEGKEHALPADGVHEPIEDLGECLGRHSSTPDDGGIAGRTALPVLTGSRKRRCLHVGAAPVGRVGCRTRRNLRECVCKSAMSQWQASPSVLIPRNKTHPFRSCALSRLHPAGRCARCRKGGRERRRGCWR